MLKDFYQGVVKRRWKRFTVATCADFEEVQTRSAAESQRCCFCLKPHSGSLAAWWTDWLANWWCWSYDSASCAPAYSVQICQRTNSFLLEAFILLRGGVRGERCWRFSLKKRNVSKGKKCVGFMPQGHVWMFLSRGLMLRIFHSKWHLVFLTTLEPCLVQARVRGGLPVHAHVKAASIPVSTVMGLGSDNNLGPTRDKTDSPVKISQGKWLSRFHVF